MPYANIAETFIDLSEEERVEKAEIKVIIGSKKRIMKRSQRVDNR